MAVNSAAAFLALVLGTSAFALMNMLLLALALSTLAKSCHNAPVSPSHPQFLTAHHKTSPTSTTTTSNRAPLPLSI